MSAAHARPPVQSPPLDAVQAAERVRAFLNAHEAVKIWEQGRIIARLRAEDCGFALSVAGASLVCHFWSPDANLVRRVQAIAPDQPEAARLRLDCLRMGQTRPTRLVLDAAPDAMAAPRIARAEFREALIAAARRDWPEWQLDVAAGSAAGPVQQLLFRRGGTMMVCGAVADEETSNAAEAAQALGLVWAEKIRRRFPAARLVEVRLVTSAWPAVQPRLALLTRAARLSAFRLDRSAGRLNPWNDDEVGNWESHLRRPLDARTAPPTAALELLAEVRRQLPDAELLLGSDALATLHVRGLEFARSARPGEGAGASFCFGCGAERTPLVASTQELFTALLRDLRQRHPDGQRHHAFYATQPERWMESLLRGRMERIEPRIDSRSIYSQLPICRAGHRDIVDLLGIDRDGRLLVIELKARSDLGFPLQALDYWLRVRHHQEAGDFERLGYFPGVPLSPLPPRLLLVAPALQWHPHTPELLHWFSPAVPWERIGLNENWREQVQVVARWTPDDTQDNY